MGGIVAKLFLKKLLFLGVFGAFVFGTNDMASASQGKGPGQGKLSAYRKPGVSYSEYLKNVPDYALEFSSDLSDQNLDRSLDFSPSLEHDPSLEHSPSLEQQGHLSEKSLLYLRSKRSSAKSMAVPFAKLDTSKMEVWTSEHAVKEAFEKIRDERFLEPEDGPKFLRRSSWLYPMDGCFARAGLAVKNLTTWKYPTVYKVFVFGDLTVDTLNSPVGQVTWWFHVVPAVKLGEEVYVLDPAIEPHTPLLLKSWLQTMSVDIKSLKVAICDGQTYSPGDSCLAPKRDPLDDWGRFDQMDYLSLEWKNLLKLKRSPEKELGDSPPWLEQSPLNTPYLVVNSKRRVL